jgi:hypothetical protein
MQETTGRKYQIVTEDEIDLVLKCRDIHEFYEQYFKAFPNSKKGPDSLSRIWKRRSEFAKKRQPQPVQVTTSPQEIIGLLTEQNQVLNTLLSLTRESLEINKQIVSELVQQNDILLRGRTRRTPVKPQNEPPLETPAMNTPVQNKSPEKLAPVMVAS